MANLDTRKIKAILVDDHPMVREEIRRFLEREERIAVVGEASSAEEALRKMNPTPDVVLMYIRLRGIDGIAATSKLRETYPEMRVVVLTSFRDEYLDQTMEAGAGAYILKTAT